MTVLLNLEGKTVNKNEMGFYCSKYCKYNSVCNDENKIPKLPTTTRAIEMYKARKHYNLEFLNMPLRTSELVDIVESIVEREKQNG